VSKWFPQNFQNHPIKGKCEVVPGALTKHHAMQVHSGVKVYLHTFLTSALNGSEWLSFTPKEITPIPIG
jgi:hypothetical protein